MTVTCCTSTSLQTCTKPRLVVVVAGLLLGGLLCAPSVGKAEAPYPVIFVHGLNSSDAVWVDGEDGVIPHLNSVGFSSGGRFEFTLRPLDTLQDVVIDSEEIWRPDGDLWRVNFESEEEPASNCAAIYLQAQALNLVISRVKELTGRDRVILVGHSMGGLASAAYLVGDPNRDGNPDFFSDDVAKLVTMGTPFGGARFTSLSNLICDGENNAARDLSKGSGDHVNIFLFGGSEEAVGTDFPTQDVSCNGSVETDQLRGMNEFAHAEWPDATRLFWIVGQWRDGSDDCVVEKEDQLLAFGDSKLIHAAHANACFVACTETESFDVIVEALDEADLISEAWNLPGDGRVHGFITRHESSGTDLDLFRTEAQGIGRLEVMLSNLPVSGTTLRLLDAAGQLACADCEDSGDSGNLSVSMDVNAPEETTFYIEVSGWADPSDPAFPTALNPTANACDKDDTDCPHCREPYLLELQSSVAPSSVDVSADPALVHTGEASTITAVVRDSSGAPAPGGVEVSFSTGYSGSFGGCNVLSSGCTTTTNTAGEASVTFSSSVVGTATISAAPATGGTASTPITFGEGTVNASASPNPVEVDHPSTINVTVHDATGAPVGSGVPVTFRTSYPGIFSGNGAGSSSPQTLLTDANGETWIRFTGTASGTANITIEAENADAVVAPIVIEAPSTDIQVSLAVGFVTGTDTYSDYELEAMVSDSGGAPIAGEPVTFTTSRGSLPDDDCNTGPTGVCDVDLRVSSSGEVTVTAEARGIVAATTFYAQVGEGGSAEMFPVRTLDFADEVWGLDFSPDGSTFAAVDRNGNVEAWNTSDWSFEWSAETSDDKNVQLAFSPDGSRVLVTHSDGVDIFNRSNGSLYCAVINATKDRRWFGTFASSSSFFLTNDFDLFRHTSLCGTGSKTYTASDNYEITGHMDHSSDRDLLVAATQGGRLMVFDGSTGSFIRSLAITSGDDDGGDTVFSSDGSKVLAVGWRVVKIFDSFTWTSTSLSAQGISDDHWGASFLDSDTKVAIGGRDKVEILEVAGGSSYRIGNVNGAAYEIAWNPSTQELAVGTTGRKVHVFEPLAPPDTRAPVIQVSTPENDSSTRDSVVTTTGRVTDESSVSSFTIDGVAVALDSNGGFADDISLAPGSNSITYRASDPAGNESTVQIQVTRLVDDTPPAINDVAVTPAIGSSGTGFTISASVVDGDTGVASVTAKVRDAGGSLLASRPMANVSGDVYRAMFDSTGAAAGFYTVDIEAVDSSSNANTRAKTSAAGFEVAICHPLNLSHTGQGSDPMASPGASQTCPPGAYFASSDISLTAAAAEGWSVSGWSGTVNDASDATVNSVVMPPSAHTAAVVYLECPTDVVVSERSVSGPEVIESCGSVTLGPNLTVTGTGTLTLRAPGPVVFVSGFQVEEGGRLSVQIDPPLSP